MVEEDKVTVSRLLAFVVTFQGALTLFLISGILELDGMANGWWLTLNCVVQLVIGLVLYELTRSQKSGSLARVAASFAIGAAMTGWIAGAASGMFSVHKEPEPPPPPRPPPPAENSGGGGGFRMPLPGRPLRVRGLRIRAALRRGLDWVRGRRPDPTGLDDATRAALETLWLRDAEAEHASVPAFARLSWLLAAAGAPADLLAWAHRAALEEIGHAQACFALAAGYGDRTFSAGPMPALQRGLEVADPLVTLAIENLGDGCLLEDFNADLAAAAAATCTEPVSRSVLEQIAREERSHAELAWAIVAWLLEHHGDAVSGALDAVDLAAYPRPAAVSPDDAVLVAGASQLALRAHGRLPDVEWEALWTARVTATQARLADLRPELRAAA